MAYALCWDLDVNRCCRDYTHKEAKLQQVIGTTLSRIGRQILSTNAAWEKFKKLTKWQMIWGLLIVRFESISITEKDLL
jgi:hypothetical protein